MKFSSICVLSVASAAALMGTSDAFRPASTTTSSKRTFGVVVGRQMSTAEEVDTSEPKMTKKNRRLEMMKSPQFFRKGFKEVREGVESSMEEEYQSDIVKEMRSNNFVMEREGVRVHLAKDFGFCWGVERSIALAYEAVEHYPGRTLHMTNELIHNPEVNEKLEDMKVNFIEKLDDGKKDFDTVQDGDVVIYPAFGASIEEMEYFNDKNVDVVDTTCPWVSKVWNTIDKHQKQGLTSVIHGKYGHEETIATTSFCEDYICVKNMKEAEMVADYIVNGGDRDEFMKYFEKAASKGFDPDTMLTKVGLANQTTMYKKETRAIGQLLQKAMMKKYGPAEVKSHYMEFDTICDATQERQDAVHELVENYDELGLDFILVVGGWDSSNTAHLLEIPVNAGLRAFHINRAQCIGADNTITHRTITGEIKTEPFILDMTKDVAMGVTSGASTPDVAVQDSLSSIFMLKKVNAPN